MFLKNKIIDGNEIDTYKKLFNLIKSEICCEFDKCIVIDNRFIKGKYKKEKKKQ